MSISIVGGGIGGLYMAYRLLQQDPMLDICIFEKSANMGGKVRTIYDKDGSVLMEGGPWRILHHHKHMRRLCHGLGCRLVAVNKKHTTPLDLPECTHTKDGALSQLDLQILCNGERSALDAEMATGYYGSMDMDSMFQTHYPTDYFVLEEGFADMIRRLVERLPSHILHANTMVQDVEHTPQGYILQCQRRDKNRYTYFQHRSKRVILACPPHYFQHWKISPHLQPLASCVVTRALNHMYCKLRRTLPEELQDCYYKTDNILNQIISSNYQNDWLQVSYTSGRMAEFWNRLYMAHPDRCRLFVEENLKHLFHDSFPIQEIKNFYWENAVHQWKPAYGFDKNRMLFLSLYPHPIQLPDLFVVGEAFSKHQGWMEGALDTVERLLHGRHPTSPPLPDQYIVYDDRVINVKNWKRHHPGSMEAIMNHMHEDVTLLWRRIHNSAQSQRLLLYNQTAWKPPKTNTHIPLFDKKVTLSHHQPNR